MNRLVGFLGVFLIGFYLAKTTWESYYDVTLQGEIEGLTFDKKNNSLLLLYNRGARIVLGMPQGFYEGYDKEISEVFTYKIGK